MIRALSFAFLLVAVLLSALNIVLIRDDNRQLFVQVEDAKTQHDVLRLQGVQLAIEKSLSAANGRIDKTARQQLGMKSPSYEETVFIKP